MRFVILLVLAMCMSHLSHSQTLTQVLRGSVVDKQVKNTLVGATVVITPSDPTLAAFTDAAGVFRFDNVPVGNYTITVTYLGYKPSVLPNVLINSGKETVLTIEMEEAVVKMNEVIIQADKRKDLPLNEMSTVSTRTFSVEETQRYAASVNDPGRMVTSYAGVIAPDDGNNRIVIRGNAPNGLLWRMEGIDIPNPNHFSDVGTSGGGISILSSALMANSDFSTGAFAAEYGNALSGVFDLKLRKGNNEQREHTAKVGFLGLSLASEGPFSKNYKGSYIVNYRYSTLGILSQLGTLGDDFGVTTFQDLSYHVYLPTKKAGYFSLFGFGGLSNQRYDAVKDSADWKSSGDRYGGTFFANTGAAGITHGFIFNSKAYLKTALAISSTGNGYDETFIEDDYNPVVMFNNDFVQHKQTLSSVLNYKFNSQLSLRSGLVQSRLQYGLKSQHTDEPGDPLQTLIDEDGSTQTSQAFTQLQYKPTDKLTFNGGVHFLMLWLNETKSVEPRASVKWDFTEKQSIALGYGLHSQMQPIGTYFAKRVDENGGVVQPNHDLDFTKAHHFVLSHNYLIGPNLRLKSEVYYQSLFNVPVAKDTANAFSILNAADGFVTEPLANKGTGKNYGAEFTVEKFLSNRYYFMLSTSLYESKYEGSDGVERNTRYNGNYAATLTAGKEWVLSRETENTLLSTNLKVIYAGGFRYTPIDLEASQAQNEPVRKEHLSYTA
ncbi:MAG TPA: TonB-dependent receptor, partial [Chitinophagales bacterium]|nr:TonB-dependent receptor [Chitinophagales bacterium]